MTTRPRKRQDKPQRPDWWDRLKEGVTLDEYRKFNDAQRRSLTRAQWGDCGGADPVGFMNDDGNDQALIDNTEGTI